MEHLSLGVLRQFCFCRSDKFQSAINSFGSGDAYTQKLILSSCLFSAKPLPEPVLVYYQLDPWEQFSAKFESKYKFLSKNTLKHFIWMISAILFRSKCVEDWRLFVDSCIESRIIVFPTFWKIALNEHIFNKFGATFCYDIIEHVFNTYWKVCSGVNVL